MLESKIRANRSSSDLSLAAFSAKSWQLPVAALFVSLIFLSGCNSKPDSTSTANSNETKPGTNAATTGSKIDVNSAAIAELDKLELPGTKPSLSERIQGKRPYNSPDDLVSKKAISIEEYNLIKNLIVVGKAK
jgi:DNA uptake protein ComE-like DNA-binding protein